VKRPREVLGEVWGARGAALMGVLNVTPDSFYDGGRYASEPAALGRVDELIHDGADVIDIGGESSRPGSEPVPSGEQIRRIEGAVRYALERARALVSIDTTRPEVAERMLELGAHMINDISCLSDPELAKVSARHGAMLIVMHSRGPMSKMKGFSKYPEDGYRDVVGEVRSELRSAHERALAAGMPARDVIWDPGLGFAKSARQSFELLARLEELTAEGVPIAVGPGRKSFIGSLDEAPAEKRLGGTIAACLGAVERGARLLRVHDVAEVGQALRVARRIGSPQSSAPSPDRGHAEA